VERFESALAKQGQHARVWMDGPETPGAGVRLTPATPVAGAVIARRAEAGHYVLSALFSGDPWQHSRSRSRSVVLRVPHVAGCPAAQDLEPSTTAFIEMRRGRGARKGQQPHRVQRWVSYGRVSPDLKRAVLVAETMRSGSTKRRSRTAAGIDEADWTRGRFVRAAARSRSSWRRTCTSSPSKTPLRKLQELIIAPGSKRS